MHTFAATDESAKTYKIMFIQQDYIQTIVTGLDFFDAAAFTSFLNGGEFCHLKTQLRIAQQAGASSLPHPAEKS